MKTALRKWAKEERKKYCCDSVLIEKLIETEEYKLAKNIMIFYPLKDEVNLLPILKDKTKNFYLPKIDGKNLLCCPYSEGDELCESCFKTKEPKASNAINPDMVIVPALAVDKNNYRLGYGGGFYDRFIPTLKPECKTITVVPFELLTDNLPHEDFDIKTDLIITN